MKAQPQIAFLYPLVAALGIGGTAAGTPDDRFHGGAYDGAASGMFVGYNPPDPGASARYVGAGGYDGYASASATGYTPPLPGASPRFVGAGGFDGYASGSFASYTPPTPGEYGRFRGDGHDGYAGGSATGQSNPLAGDSDGDGVPDWWEARHYLSLTRADAATDLDGDGQGSLFEYLADLDPWDATSRLAVVAFERDANLVVSSETTSVERVYWIEVAETLDLGAWAPVTLPPVPGNGGLLEISFPDAWDRVAFFRLRVGLPPE